MSSPKAKQIDPARVRYIKLGQKGGWEQECLKKGIIRIGFGSAQTRRFGLCKSGQWKKLTRAFIDEGKNKGTATRFTNELRLFFEDRGATLWITFISNLLYWGLLENSPPHVHTDGDGVWRPVRGKWRATDSNGILLSKDRLSGALTKLAAYRGTSCDVDVAEYVVRRINGQKMPEVESAIAATQELQVSLLPLMRMLIPQDFELLVDLVFAASGWRRVGVVGRAQDTLDLDLVLPSTGERAFVQVKSRTTPSELTTYSTKLGERATLYGRMFFVYHSGKPGAARDRRVTVIGPEELAALLVDAGLVRWLIEKVS